MSKRRKSNRRNNSTGGRYTPPSGARQEATERQRFWADYGNADQSLRDRCAELLGEPLTDEEWRASSLLEMGGNDATDEQLTAYWQTHRRSIELDYDEVPDLAYVKETLNRGEDPVRALEALYDSDEGETLID